jgi:hypothetical protein
LCPISKKVAGKENESSIARECLAWIYKKMPNEYCWPGNARELE